MAKQDSKQAEKPQDFNFGTEPGVVIPRERFQSTKSSPKEVRESVITEAKFPEPQTPPPAKDLP
jgi:hypothetical protein